MKKLITLSIAIFAAFCMISMNPAYADGWTDGWDVVSCGVDDASGMYTTLTDGTVQYTYWADATISTFTNQALAVCLSAQATTKKIDILRFNASNKFRKIRYHR
jgi:hypothetical protein